MLRKWPRPPDWLSCSPVDLQSLTIDRSAKPAARRRGRSSPWFGRLVFLCVLGAAAWLFLPVLQPLVDQLRLPLVKVAVVSESTPAASAAVQGTAANGYVTASRRAALSSDISGRIVEMLVTEGSVVKKGDVVARLFADEYRAGLQRAEADLATARAGQERAAAAIASAELSERQAVDQAAAAEAQVAEAEAQAALAQSELARTVDLQRSGSSSEQALDRAKAEAAGTTARLTASRAGLRASRTAAAAASAQVAVARSDRAVADSQLESARAAVAQAQATLDKMEVRAPFDGIVVLKDAEVGEVVSPFSQGGSNARGAVCTMVDFDSLEVQADVPESSLGAVRQGAPVDVFLDAYPDRRYPAKVDRVWPVADRQKATVEVRMKLLERDERLRPDMGVRVVFRRDEPTAPSTAAAEERSIVVAEGALLEIEGRTGAFVLERDVVRWTALTVGERKGGRARVASGLRVGQKIVLEPPTTLRDGDRVRTEDN